MPSSSRFGIGLATVLMLCHHSSKANEEKSRTRIGKIDVVEREHMPVDDSVSGGTWLFCLCVFVAVMLLAFS